MEFGKNNGSFMLWLKTVSSAETNIACGEDFDLTSDPAQPPSAFRQTESRAKVARQIPTSRNCGFDRLDRGVKKPE